MDLNNRVGGRADLQGFRTLLPLFDGNHKRIVLISALSGVSSVAVLVMFFLVGRSVGMLTQTPVPRLRLVLLAAGIIVAGLGGAAAGHARAALSADLAAEVTTELQRRTFHRRVHDGLERITVNPAGRVVTSILHDLPLVPAFLLNAVSSAAGSLVTVLAVISAVIAVDIRLLAVLAVPAALIVPYRRIERRMRRAAVDKIQAMAGLQVFLEQRFALSGVKFARTFGLAVPIGREFSDRVGVLENDTAVMQRMISLAGSLTTAAHAAFLALVILVAGAGPLAGDVSAAGLVVLVLCTPLLIGVLQTYSTIGYWVSTAVAIVENLGLRAGTPGAAIADRRRDPPHSSASDVDADGHEPPVVLVRDLRYRYPATRFGSTGADVLKSVSLELRNGDFLAVVGEVGCGKSTLALLLAGLLRPSSGSVRISRIAVPGASRDVCLVDGNDHLFSVSLADNLRMVDRSLSLRRMVEICRAVGVHDYVSELPQGYDTVVGERGMRLSSGQRQLLVLARAIAARPATVVLDEATSCLDSAAELRAVSGLREQFSGPIIMVAHRLSTAMMADRVLVLDGGVVASAGSHSELIASSGLYRRFHELQTI